MTVPRRYKARRHLAGEDLAALELTDLEVASVWRRSVRRGELTLRRAGLALADLAALPVSRARHQRLVAQCWELRDDLTIYDAAYVALAEALGVMLVTADRRMAGAARIKSKVDVLV